jgi:nitrate/nitrite transporter NarK
VALCAEIFGDERSGVVYGWVFAGHQLGAALAAYGAGAIRGSTGSYELAFHLAGGLCIGAAIAVQAIGRRRGPAPVPAPVPAPA